MRADQKERVLVSKQTATDRALHAVLEVNMTTTTSSPSEQESLALPAGGPFDAQLWLNYFERNKDVRSMIELPQRIILPEALSTPLLRSLQRFQIGETGEGKHLKKFARRLGSAEYYQCVDLFIKEEQGHGQILAEAILALNGTLLQWHWSDLCFIVLRRLLGLKTELFIILIAEIIGKCFYRCVSDKITNQSLSNAFAIIVCDEIAHLRFHSEFLGRQLASAPWYLKYFVHYAWSMIFYTACFVFVLDHRQTLQALEVSTPDFIADCSREFQRSSRCALGVSY